MQGDVIGIERDRKSGDIGNILIQGLPAIYRQVREGLVAIELSHQHLCRGMKMGQIVICPPVVQLARGIEQRSCAVEAVADFMADYRADGTIVDGRVPRGVEVWRLEDGCWEVQ